MKLLLDTHILLRQGMSILPIQTAHLQRLLSLSFHHRDPFDWLIIAQALAEEMTLLSRYPDTRKLAFGTLLGHTAILGQLASTIQDRLSETI